MSGLHHQRRGKTDVQKHCYPTCIIFHRGGALSAAGRTLPQYDMSGDNSSPTYVITLRAERPIEGCELTPNAFLQLKGGNLDNSARAKLMDAKPFQYVFTWSRSPRGRMCNNNNCVRAETFDPAMWSKAQLHGPQLVCNVCLSAGKHSNDINFCSARYPLVDTLLSRRVSVISHSNATLLFSQLFSASLEGALATA